MTPVFYIACTGGIWKLTCRHCTAHITYHDPPDRAGKWTLHKWRQWHMHHCGPYLELLDEAEQILIDAERKDQR